MGRLFGGCLRCETRFVNTVVDIIIRPIIRSLNLRPQLLREQIDALEFLRKQFVEFGIEHPNDFGRFIADDFILLLIVQCRHGETTCIIRIDVEIDVAQVRKVFVERIRRYVVAGDLFVWSCETPSLILMSEPEIPGVYNEGIASLTLLQHLPMHRSIRNKVLQPLEFTNDERPVCYQSSCQPTLPENCATQGFRMRSDHLPHGQA